MVTVVGVRFKAVGKIYYFAKNDLKIEKNDKVIVETSRGVEFGEVVLIDRVIDENTLATPLKDVIRVATDEDIKHHEDNKKRQPPFFIFILILSVF